MNVKFGVYTIFIMPDKKQKFYLWVWKSKFWNQMYLSTYSLEAFFLPPVWREFENQYQFGLDSHNCLHMSQSQNIFGGWHFTFRIWDSWKLLSLWFKMFQLDNGVKKEYNILQCFLLARHTDNFIRLSPELQIRWSSYMWRNLKKWVASCSIT